MELREIFAYAILALLALFFIGVAVWFRHNSHQRTIRRMMRRDDEAYERRIAERERDER